MFAVPDPNHRIRFSLDQQQIDKGNCTESRQSRLVCPSGKTTRVAVKGFFVRNHFKIAFSKISRVPLQILTENLELFWGRATRAVKNDENLLTSGPTQNLPCLDREG